MTFRPQRDRQTATLLAALVTAAAAMATPEVVAAQPNPVPLAEDGTGFGDHTNYAPKEQ